MTTLYLMLSLVALVSAVGAALAIWCAFADGGSGGRTPSHDGWPSAATLNSLDSDLHLQGPPNQTFKSGWPQ